MPDGYTVPKDTTKRTLVTLLKAKRDSLARIDNLLAQVANERMRYAETNRRIDLQLDALYETIVADYMAGNDIPGGPVAPPPMPTTPRPSHL